jgi:hypothetical protein
MTEQEKDKVEMQCVKLIGHFASMGNHIHYKGLGVTICCMFTKDYDKEKFKDMPADVPQDYKVVKWDITCKQCIEMFELMRDHDKREKERKKNWN